MDYEFTNTLKYFMHELLVVVVPQKNCKLIHYFYLQYWNYSKCSYWWSNYWRISRYKWNNNCSCKFLWNFEILIEQLCYKYCFQCILQEAMRKMNEADKQKIIQQVELFRLEKLTFDSEVAKWDDTGNDIIYLAKHMCMIMMEMTDFTRWVFNSKNK